MGQDAKTKLKELADRRQIGSPKYDTQRHGGPEHEPGWLSTVTLPSGESADGVGHSKVEAEQHAADALLQKLKLTQA